MAKNLTAEERRKGIARILRRYEKRNAEIDQRIRESFEKLKMNDVQGHLEKMEQQIEGLKKIASKLDSI